MKRENIMTKQLTDLKSLNECNIFMKLENTVWYVKKSTESK